MELVLLVIGVAAAIIAGVAWAVHSRGLAEGADKVSLYGFMAALGLSVLEAWKEWDEWSTYYLHVGQFGPDGSYHPHPRPPEPDFWRQARHIGGQLLLEVVRDLSISAVAFGLLFLVLRASKGRRTGAA